MILADVIGTVVAEAEVIAFLRGKRLLLVRPVTPEGQQAQPKPRVAVDTIGAAAGDRVLVIDEGNSGRQIMGEADAPVKTLVVGFVDEVEIGGRIVYDHRGGPESKEA